MKIGYDIILSTEVKESLSSFGTKMNFSRPATTQTDIQCFEAFLLKNKEQEIVLYNLEGIGCFTFIQLAKSLRIIDEHQIAIHFLNPMINGVKIKQNFLTVLNAIVAYEEKIVVTRTKAGLAIAKSKGHIGGRPKISEETVKQIRYLNDSRKKTKQEISAELNVSLGTVYKYLTK